MLLVWHSFCSRQQLPARFPDLHPVFSPPPPSKRAYQAKSDWALSVLQAMAILNGVERSLSGSGPGARKRTRHSNSPSKMAVATSEDLAKHSSPTLQSSSMAEHDSDDSLDWPTTGPFSYHRWHVMVERWGTMPAVQLMQSIGGMWQVCLSLAGSVMCHCLELLEVSTQGQQTMSGSCCCNASENCSCWGNILQEQCGVV